MSFRASLVKMAIHLTPDVLVKWVANIVLKGIAELSDFSFDLDTRSVYVRLTLYGEAEPIEIEVDNFAIVSADEGSQFVVQKAKSNRLWLNNIFAHIVGKPWKIPELPQFKAQIELLAELLKTETPEPEMQTSLPEE